MTICNDLRQAVLQAAMQGKLTVQEDGDKPVDDLLTYIRDEKNKKIKKKILKKAKVKYSELDDAINDIPDYWKWANVDDLFSVTKLAGFEYTKYFTKQNISKDNEVPIVRAHNVKMNKFVENNEERISLELSTLLERSSLTKDCILMTFIGAGIGDVCCFLSNKRQHLAPNVAKIEQVVEELNLKYFLYFCSYILKNEYIQLDVLLMLLIRSLFSLHLEL